MNIAAPIINAGRVVKSRLTRTSFLEKLGLFAMALLVFNSLFEVSFTIQRRDYLNRLLSSAPPSVSNAANVVNAEVDPTVAEVADKVLPRNGVELPVAWGTLGKQLVETGVIDMTKMEALYAQRGGMSPELKSWLTSETKGKLRITEENASHLLNVFWALGLGNKNDILEKGEMSDPQYGGAGGFASTGGWVIAQGDPMNHYSKHEFVKLTPAQQALVDKISKGIYRPCCGNSTHFPDCNHGMAMLGLLELMASQGVKEQDMWNAALAVNAYWFPDTYVTIAQYLKSRGSDWNKTRPQELLSETYSSGQGYRVIAAQVNPTQQRGGGGCGV